MTPLLDRLSASLGTEALTDLMLSWTAPIIAAVFVGVGFLVLERVLRRVMAALLGKAKVDATAAAFVLATLRIVLTTIGLLAVLDQLGVDTKAFLASLGVMGLTVGFAAQNTLSNLISGIFIFWDRPFVLNDLVEVDGEYGRVEEITLRSTRLVTPDGRMIAVPNSIMANSKVASYTNFPHLRLDIEVGVAVDTPLGRAREILLGVVHGDVALMAEPAPVVVTKALNDDHVLLELRVWLDDETTHVAQRFRIREALFDALNAAGVEMPFKQLQLRPVQLAARQ